MSATIRNVETESPLSGVSVSVDGNPPVLTDTDGRAAVPSGLCFDLGPYGKVKFHAAEDAAEIWIEGDSPPPPPPPDPNPLSSGS